MQRTTYKQRREGTAGIGSNMTRALHSANQAATKPHEMQKALGLADADRRMKGKKHKLALKQARARRDRK